MAKTVDFAFQQIAHSFFAHHMAKNEFRLGLHQLRPGESRVRRLAMQQICNWQAPGGLEHTARLISGWGATSLFKKYKVRGGDLA